jgi:Mg-chelatase subunit ChlD
MNSRCLAAALAACAALLPFPSTAAAQEPPRPAAGRGSPPPTEVKSTPLGQGATETLAHSYGETTSWAMKALVLLSLGDDYHPTGAGMLADALRGKDDRLRAFGIEQVLRTGPRVVETLATPALVDALVAGLAERNPHVRTRTLAALARLLPGATAKKPEEWRQWWNAQRSTWTPPAWTPAEAQASGTVSQRLVERAFDLRDAGLQVVFVVDSTGSMQVAIDAARDAIDEVATILAGVTDRLELGLVHYKDDGDMTDAADLLVPLTKDHQKVRDKLAKLTAAGGGDVPERIEAGIRVALGKATGWDKDKNRMLLVIGDAPPHPDAERGLLDLVQRAYTQPFATGKGPTTGAPTTKLRPFVTSTIATNPTVKDVFEAIAKAGGGASVVMPLHGRPHPPGRGKAADKEPAGPSAPPAPPQSRRTAGQQIAEHVLLLSFGAGYEAQLRVFVDVFFTYRNAGAF